MFHSYVWPQGTRKKTWKTHFAKWHISMRVLPCQVSFWNGKNGLLLDVTWYHCSNGLLNSIKAWVREFLQKPMFFYASIVSSNVLHSPCLLWARPTLYPTLQIIQSPMWLYLRTYSEPSCPAQVSDFEEVFHSHRCFNRSTSWTSSWVPPQAAGSQLKALGFGMIWTPNTTCVGSKKSLQPLWRTTDEGLLILLVWHGSRSCMEIWFVPLSLSRKAFLAVRLRSIKAFFNPMDFWLPLWSSRMKPLHHP